QSAARDAPDLPRHRAQRKHVAADRFLGEVLFDVADLASFGLDHNIVVARFRNRSARNYRRKPCTTARTHPAIGRIEVDLRLRALDALRELRGHLCKKTV